MKINLDCEQFKPSSRKGNKERCNCKFLNRRFPLQLKIYKLMEEGAKKAASGVERPMKGLAKSM